MLGWLARLLEASGLNSVGLRHGTLWVLSNLAGTASGCALLIEHGIAEKLSHRLLCDRLRGITAVSTLLTLDSIARSGRAAVDTLAQRGVVAHLGRYMAEVYGEGALDVGAAVHQVLPKTMAACICV